MCGICGFADFTGRDIPLEAGRAMLELLRHRGPDGEGYEARQAVVGNGQVGAFIGQRRLKIIDLSDAARNPLPNEDGTVQVTFNGEIYNFRELRRTLEQHGHVFRSRSDTETIVHAYEQYGDDCVTHLDGMFAFAIWDQRAGSLFLARDRSGKKPLYYAFNGRQFTFASEIKALLACPWVSHDVAQERIAAYLTYGYVPTPETLFRDVLQVSPGSYLKVSPQGLAGPTPYWNVRPFLEQPPEQISAADAAGRLRQLLTAAVERRLVSDVPLGALLSGGLDSTIVVGIASKLQPDPIRTFTVGFADDPSYDERPDARVAAQHYRTLHTDCVLRADVAALIEPLVWHYDQPYGDSSAVATYLVSRMAREHVTVALNGDGGDEVFGGYDRFVAALLADRIPRAFFTPLRAATAWLPASDSYYSLARRVRRFAERGAEPIENRFMSWISIFDRGYLEAVLRPNLRAGLATHDPERSVRDRLGEIRGPLLNRLLYANFTTYLPDDLHPKMDRMSMAVALETRSPILDTAVVEFVMGLPANQKIRGFRTKHLLRAAFQDMLPPALRKKRKHGFNVPIRRWLRAELKDYVRDHLVGGNPQVSEFLDQKAVERMVTAHTEGREDHSYRLWALLNLEVWLRLLRSGGLWNPGGRVAGALDVRELRTESYA